jgi:Lrp/AsnC family transcriptional regulator, leucine-responsive regulatory protein
MDSGTTNSHFVDAKDSKIIGELQKNARASIAEISNSTGILRDSVAYRIDRLNERRMIQFSCDKISSTWGCKTLSLISITLRDYNAADEKKMHEYLWSMPEVVEIVALSGKCDIMAKIAVQDATQLNAFISKFRAQFSGIIKELELFNLASERRKQIRLE